MTDVVSGHLWELRRQRGTRVMMEHGGAMRTKEESWEQTTGQRREGRGLGQSSG